MLLVTVVARHATGNNRCLPPPGSDKDVIVGESGSSGGEKQMPLSESLDVQSLYVPDNDEEEAVLQNLGKNACN